MQARDHTRRRIGPAHVPPNGLGVLNILQVKVAADFGVFLLAGDQLVFDAFGGVFGQFVVGRVAEEIWGAAKGRVICIGPWEDLVLGWSSVKGREEGEEGEEDGFHFAD